MGNINEDNIKGSNYRAGFAAIIGRANVGKSTIFNRLIGYRISIITHKPQTTRNRLLGIANDEKFQIALVDTPGVSDTKDELNEFMHQQINKAITDSDILVFVVDAKVGFNQEDLKLIKIFKNYKKPVICVLNKTDLFSNKKKVLPLLDKAKKLFDFKEYIPISAKTGQNFEELKSCIGKFLPLSEKLFSDNDITNRPEHFIVSEIIREEVLKLTHQEVPYSAAILVDEITYKRKKDITYIHANIYVERKSQKKIIIGSKGTKIKQIGKQARIKLENFLKNRVYLDLKVSILAGWKQNKNMLKKIGYDIS